MRACLLDHAAALRDGLEDLWVEPVSVTVPDSVLEQGAQLWVTTQIGLP